MNPVIKIINQIIIIINKLIDSIDRKTAETIKNSFYFIIFILLIGGVLIGYNSGKKAAKKYGKPLNETTNSIFDTKIKRESGTGRFQSMLDSELAKEKKEINLKKIELPANEKQLKPEFNHKIIESDIPDIKQPAYLEPDKVADIERTNEKLIKSDVRELKKTEPQINNSNKKTMPINKEFKIIEK